MGSTESPEYKTPQPATALASHRVLADKVAEYCEAQTAITEAARKFPGFIGTEVLSPVAGLQEEWVAIFRLESNQAMQRWLESPERKRLAARIENCLAEPAHLQVLASDDQAEPPVAMVFTHHVRKGKVDDYRAWRRKTITAQAHYPGYLATDSFEPRGQLQDEWVDIVRYDSVDHLNTWMKSEERQKLLEELTPIAESVHEHRLATGLEGWFNLNRRADEPVNVPPAWKQALSVLLALYPTVMILGLIVNPWMQNLTFPVQMLIGNILSVALLTWLIMPVVTRVLNFWLSPPTSDAAAGSRWMREALGICAVTVGITLFVLVFRSVE